MSVGGDVELLVSAQSCGVGGSVGFADGQKRFRGCLQLHGRRCSGFSLLLRQSFAVPVVLHLQSRAGPGATGGSRGPGHPSGSSPPASEFPPWVDFVPGKQARRWSTGSGR